MTTVAYALGKPRPAVSRGGDCSVYDVVQDRLVFPPHRFAITSSCRISNGLLELTLGASGIAPAFTMEAWRGRLTVEDVLSDVLSDTLVGEIGTPEWLDVGTLTIDSPAVSALLTGVRIEKRTPEIVILRLIVPAVADVYVSLRRGERFVHIQHGSARSPVDTDRRVRLTDSPSPVGTARSGRVEEVLPAIDSFPRWVAAIDPCTVNAGTFSVSAASTTSARFGAGVGTYNLLDRPYSLHAQLGNASRARIVVT